MSKYIQEKFRELRVMSGKSQAEIAKLIGVSQVAIFKLENGKINVSDEYVKKYSDLFNIPTDTFIKKIDEEALNIAKVDIISATPCCGNGNDTDEEVIGQFAIPMEDFRTITFTSPSNIKMMKVSGDSMQPTIQDGDYILADVSNTTPSDGIYLIRTLTGLAVKRIQIGLSSVEILSDNPMYKPLTTEVGELQIVGKVIKICNFKCV